MHLRPDRILVQRYEVSMQVSEAANVDKIRGINGAAGHRTMQLRKGLDPQVRYWTYQLNELVPIGVRTRDSTGEEPWVTALRHALHSWTAGSYAGLLNFIESREIPTVTDSTRHVGGARSAECC